MRVLTVLGITTLGLGLGTAAVLFPLTSSPSSSRNDWAMNWNVPAIRQMVAALSDVARPDNIASDTKVRAAAPADSGVASPTPTVRITSAGMSRDRRTFDVLTQHGSTPETAGTRVELQPWKTTVDVADASPRGSRPSSKPANEDQRYQLVRAIQVELTRVGCYAGGTDGQWSAATKRAMGQFNGRLNATLPYDEPDLILLTLVKGHRGVACSESCPAGQQLTDGGQCQPSSIMAHADRPKLQRRPTRVETPPASVAAATVHRPAVASASTATLAATPEPARAAPAQTAVADSTDTYGVAVRSAPPMPGRMAIGGPLPPAVPEINQPVTVVPEDDQPSVPAASRAARRTKPASTMIVPRKPPQAVVIRRPPQVTVAQPKKQKWHPNNPFWQNF